LLAIRLAGLQNEKEEVKVLLTRYLLLPARGDFGALVS
jgi:hypothetical protein